MTGTEQDLEQRCRAEYAVVLRTLERRKHYGGHPYPLPSYAAFRVAWRAKQARARVPEDDNGAVA